MPSYNSIVAGDDRFIRVGDSGLIEGSDDGITWLTERSNTTENLHAVSFGNVRFIAVGDNGTVVTSQSRNNWTVQAAPTAEHIYDINFAEIFMAVGANGLMMTTLDGLSWITQPPITPNHLRSVSMGGGRYLAVGDNDARVVGAFTTTYLNAVFDFNINVSDSVEQIGTTNLVIDESIQVIDDVARDGDFAPMYEVVREHVYGTLISVNTVQTDQVTAEALLVLARMFDVNEILQENITVSESFVIGIGIPPITEHIDVSDEPLWDVAFNLLVDEDIQVSDGVTDEMIFAVLVEEDVNAMGELKDPQATLEATINERVLVSGLLLVAGQAYNAWVINTKNESISQYLNYDFNSFCEYNGRFFAIGENGMYELTSDKDSGGDIQAVLKTGILNFGTEFQKRIPRAYLGIQNDGQVVLKTITNENVERWYELTEVSSGMSRARVKLSKGVRSSYWQFELVSNEFIRLESIDLMPVVLTRRPQSKINAPAP